MVIVSAFGFLYIMSYGQFKNSPKIFLKIIFTKNLEKKKNCWIFLNSSSFPDPDVRNWMNFKMSYLSFFRPTMIVCYLGFNNGTHRNINSLFVGSFNISPESKKFQLRDWHRVQIQVLHYWLQDWHNLQHSVLNDYMFQEQYFSAKDI